MKEDKNHVDIKDDRENRLFAVLEMTQFWCFSVSRPHLKETFVSAGDSTLNPFHKNYFKFLIENIDASINIDLKDMIVEIIYFAWIGLARNKNLVTFTE